MPSKKPNPKNEQPAPKTSGYRLNQFIAKAGVCSRRNADELIKGGQIRINGKKHLEPGYRVLPGDRVEYRGTQLFTGQNVYILLNKPKGFITTTADEKGRKTVLDLLKHATDERIYPVGRLDRNTTGLLLLTNDGNLAQKLSHPSSNIKKVYYARLDKPVEEEDLTKIKEGLTLEDGPVKVDDIAYSESGDPHEIGIIIHLGKNRIIRRIFEHLKYDVVKLDRVLYAGLTKKNLPRGKWRHLSKKEIITLKHFTK